MCIGKKERDEKREKSGVCLCERERWSKIFLSVGVLRLERE